MIKGWQKKYSQILQDFNYNKKDDLESAKILDKLLTKKLSEDIIKRLVYNKAVFVIGAGPSLSSCVKFLKKYKTTKIVADSAVKFLLKNKIKPDIVVTDLDGDIKSLKKIGRTKTIMVVHAHGDNQDRLQLVKNFKNCIGTTQTRPFRKVQNFGGFTDGDRAVFFAAHFKAKKVILFGIDFGNKIGRYSITSPADRKTKLKKLRYGKKLLEWLAKSSSLELYTTSGSIRGFEKIQYKELDEIIF